MPPSALFPLLQHFLPTIVFASPHSTYSKQIITNNHNINQRRLVFNIPTMHGPLIACTMCTIFVLATLWYLYGHNSQITHTATPKISIKDNVMEYVVKEHECDERAVLHRPETSRKCPRPVSSTSSILVTNFNISFSEDPNRHTILEGSSVTVLWTLATFMLFWLLRVYIRQTICLIVWAIVGVFIVVAAVLTLCWHLKLLLLRLTRGPITKLGRFCAWYVSYADSQLNIGQDNTQTPVPPPQTGLDQQEERRTALVVLSGPSIRRGPDQQEQQNGALIVQDQRSMSKASDSREALRKYYFAALVFALRSSLNATLPNFQWLQLPGLEIFVAMDGNPALLAHFRLETPFSSLTGSIFLGFHSAPDIRALSSSTPSTELSSCRVDKAVCRSTESAHLQKAILQRPVINVQRDALPVRRLGNLRRTRVRFSASVLCNTMPPRLLLPPIQLIRQPTAPKTDGELEQKNEPATSEIKALMNEGPADLQAANSAPTGLELSAQYLRETSVNTKEGQYKPKQTLKDELKESLEERIPSLSRPVRNTKANSVPRKIIQRPPQPVTRALTTKAVKCAEENLPAVFRKQSLKDESQAAPRATKLIPFTLLSLSPRPQVVPICDQEDQPEAIRPPESHVERSEEDVPPPVGPVATPQSDCTPLEAMQPLPQPAEQLQEQDQVMVEAPNATAIEDTRPITRGRHLLIVRPEIAHKLLRKLPLVKLAGLRRSRRDVEAKGEKKLRETGLPRRRRKPLREDDETSSTNNNLPPKVAVKRPTGATRPKRAVESSTSNTTGTSSSVDTRVPIVSDELRRDRMLNADEVVAHMKESAVSTRRHLFWYCELEGVLTVARNRTKHPGCMSSAPVPFRRCHARPNGRSHACSSQRI